MTIDKKKIFDCPLNLILTDEGINSIIKAKRQPQKIETAEKSSVYGLKLSNFTFMSLKKLIEEDYTHKIELPVCRENLIEEDLLDLTRLFTFNMIYRKFEHIVLSYLIDSPLVEHWNSFKTGIEIKEQTIINDNAIFKIAVNRNIDINQVKQSVIDPVKNKIISSQQYSPSQKNMILFIVEKLIDSVQHVVWLCYAMQEPGEIKDTFINITYDLIDDYLSKADFLTLLGTFVQAALNDRENKSMYHFAKEKYPSYSHEAILNDNVFRKNLFIENSTSRYRVTISWEITVEKDTSNKSIHHLNIKIYSCSDDFKEIKNDLESALSIEPRSMTYDDYISANPDRISNPYTSVPFIREIAAKNGIGFAIELTRTSSKDISIVSLKMQF